MNAAPMIRPFRPGDEIGAAMVAAACFEDSMRPFYTEEGGRNFAAYIYPEAIARRQSREHLMFVALLDGEIIGLIELEEFRHISMLFVSPEFQQCGIASRLLERALRFAKKASPGLAEITVYSSPGAVGAYLAWGFVESAPACEASGVRYTPMKLIL